jgi:hypothetical protein
MTTRQTRAFAWPLILALAAIFPVSSDAAPIRIAYSSISGAMLPLWVAKLSRKSTERVKLTAVFEKLNKLSGNETPGLTVQTSLD